MKNLLVLIAFFIVSQARGQCIPNVDWSYAGAKEIIQTEDSPIINFKKVKSSYSADVSDDVVIKEIIAEYKGSQIIIYFPEGNYLFKEQIRLYSNMVLKGDGANSILTFELEKERDCILAAGKGQQDTYYEIMPVAKGNSTLTLKEAHDFQEDELFYLIDEDDELADSYWAKGKTGQFVSVKASNGKKVEILGACRRDFNRSSEKMTPRLVAIDLVDGAGVQNLKIVNNRATEGQTSNIQFRYASNCFVRNVWSLDCNYSHVLMEFAVNCEVAYSSFEKAHNYGNGGKGYGVTLQFGTSNCLVADNFCNNLRHSFLLQAGANGNVISFNSSRNPFWTNVRLPEDSAGDIVLHGNYVYANLIEWNQCHTIVVDKSHGANGPDNLFFNNNLIGYGIIVSRKSKGQAFVNNTIEPAKWPKGRYKVRGKHYEQYNTIGDKVIPRKSEKYTEKKSFFK
ncbi:MAG: hypothetical protein HUJ25_16205 [Crocinitomicaceae bacterium]|nr:hypothetical protein [Crocinitomicaceae bacterium]